MAEGGDSLAVNLCYSAKRLLACVKVCMLSLSTYVECGARHPLLQQHLVRARRVISLGHTDPTRDMNNMMLSS